MPPSRATRPSTMSKTPERSSRNPPQRVLPSPNVNADPRTISVPTVENVRPHLLADQPRGQRIEQPSEAVPHHLGNQVHSPGKVAVRRETLNTGPNNEGRITTMRPSLARRPSVDQYTTYAAPRSRARVPGAREARPPCAQVTLIIIGV